MKTSIIYINDWQRSVRCHAGKADLDRQGRGEKEADRYPCPGGQNRPKGSVYHPKRHLRREHL